MSVPAITGGDGYAAVQSRISEIRARFGVASPIAFNTMLANQLGGTRTASSFSGEVPNRMPTGLSPVIDLAQQHLGVPYVWGGESPSGFDCSGLIQYVYRQLGVSLPRVAADQARVGEPVASLADAVPGDLVAFNDPVDHIGIYAGNGLMVVAPKAGDVVKVQAIYKEPTAIRRVLPSTPAPSFRADQAVQRSVLLSALGLAS